MNLFAMTETTLSKEITSKAALGPRKRELSFVKRVLNALRSVALMFVKDRRSERSAGSAKKCSRLRRPQARDASETHCVSMAESLANLVLPEAKEPGDVVSDAAGYLLTEMTRPQIPLPEQANNRAYVSYCSRVDATWSATASVAEVTTVAAGECEPEPEPGAAATEAEARAALRGEAEMLLRQLEVCGVRFSAAGHFTLGMSLWYSLVGAAATYFVVLVQFEFHEATPA